MRSHERWRCVLREVVLMLDKKFNYMYVWYNLWLFFISWIIKRIECLNYQRVMHAGMYFVPCSVFSVILGHSGIHFFKKIQMLLLLLIENLINRINFLILFAIISLTWNIFTLTGRILYCIFLFLHHNLKLLNFEWYI
jgi:hypothetical protein